MATTTEEDPKENNSNESEEEGDGYLEMEQQVAQENQDKEIGTNTLGSDLVDHNESPSEPTESGKLVQLKNIDDFLDEEERAADPMPLFLNWCKQEGVVMPKLEYPADFNGLTGIRCLEDIEH